MNPTKFSTTNAGKVTFYPNFQYLNFLIIQIMQKNFLFLTFFISIATCKLIYGFGMIRHGVKYSYSDPLTPQITNKFKAELAPTGIRQLYNLGTYLRQTYINQQAFLPQDFDHTIQCFSSSLQRTQLSTYSFLYGLYPLQQGSKIPSKIPKDLLAPPYEPLFPDQLATQPTHTQFALREGLTPIPVHPLDQILDSCTNIDLLEEGRLTQLANNQSRLYDEHFALIEKMKLLFKLSSYHGEINLMSNLYQGLQSDHYIGVTMPQDYTQQDHSQLKFLYEYYHALYNQDKFGRILATLPFQFMRSKIVQAANGQTNKKMLFLICHSSTMWPVMVNLNLTSSACIDQKRRNKTISEDQNCQVPLYASNLIVQVHQNDKTLDKVVKIKFNGKYMNVCESSHQTCPLQEFLLRIKRTEQDFDLQCGPRPKKGFITQKS